MDVRYEISPKHAETSGATRVHQIPLPGVLTHACSVAVGAAALVASAARVAVSSTARVAKAFASGVSVGKGVFVGAGVFVSVGVQIAVSVGVFVVVGIKVYVGRGVCVGIAATVARTAAAIIPDKSGVGVGAGAGLHEASKAHRTTQTVLMRVMMHLHSVRKNDSSPPRANDVDYH